MPGPLAGYRIIEIAGIGPGPFAAMMLADMGADVIRVDRAQAVRGPAPETPHHDLLLRGRRSVAIDLKHPDGIATLLDLVEAADAADRGVPTRGDGAARGRARRMPRPQPQARLRTDDRVGPGRSVRPGRRPRHQLHLAGRRARPLRAGRAGAGSPAQHDRRLRRGRDVPRLRRGVRPARGPAQWRRAGGRRGDGRRLGGADDDVLGVLAARHVRRARTRAPTCSTPAPTSTTSTAARTASTSRSVRSSRSSTPSCSASPGSTATSSSPRRWTAPHGRR